MLMSPFNIWKRVLQKLRSKNGAESPSPTSTTTSTSPQPSSHLDATDPHASRVSSSHPPSFLQAPSTFEMKLQQRLQKILDPTERDIFIKAEKDIKPDELLAKIKGFDDAYNQRSTSRRCAETLTKVFQIMNQFMSGVAIGIQADPTISSLVVGGVRLLIDIGVKFVDFFNQLTRMISRISDYLETFAMYANTVGNITPIQNALLNVYEDVFRFCKHARIIFINTDGSARSPERTSITTFFKVQWQPFEARFGEIEARFKHHSEVLLQSIQPVQLKLLQEVKSTQAVQLKSLQDVEFRFRSLMSRTDEGQSKTKTYYEVPSLQVSQYVKRPDLLKRIETSFVSAAKTTPPPGKVVLLGMGGQGKSQLALEYCRIARISEEYQAIFWIDASSSYTVFRAFEVISTKISDLGQVFDDIDSRVDFVKETLGRWERPWLMVFDNYDRLDEFNNISDYIPQGQTGTLLFTSRHAGSERLGATIKLTRMTEEEGLELLLQSKSNMTDENKMEGLKIVRKLGYLPLAIDQAGAYISQRGLPLSQFIRHYENRKEYVLKHTPSLWEYRRKLDADKDGTSLSVFTTWELSFQQIGKTETERMMIGHFLTLSAFLNASDVGEDLFRFSLTLGNKPLNWAELFTTNSAWDQYKYEDTVTKLSNLSLLQRIATGSTGLRFSLHPLSQSG